MTLFKKRHVKIEISPSNGHKVISITGYTADETYHLIKAFDKSSPLPQKK